MNPDLFTVVVGLDARTFQQFEATLPLNLFSYPWLRECRWLFFFDNHPASPVKLDARKAVDLLMRSGCNEKTSQVLGVPWATVEPYSSQREKMLTGFVIQGAGCSTPFWIKIDTDAFALPFESADEFLEPEWFEHSPAYIAPRWGYTVGSDQPHKLDNWGDSLCRGHARFDSPRLDIPFDPNARTVKHKRMCSWVSIYDTVWTQQCRELLQRPVLPVPSQDTFHWYCAERQHKYVKHVNFKRRGWRTISKQSRLLDTCAELRSKAGIGE